MKWTLVAVVALMWPVLVRAQPEERTPPNIVVIIADDLGYADMGFKKEAPADVKKYGTPGLDRLAATGTYFSHAYATSPICSPSRLGFITGRYQQRWGGYFYGHGGLFEDEKTLPEMLKERGYATAKVGKTHLNGGSKEFPTLHGFDEYLGFLHHTWDYIRLSEKDVEAYRGRKGFRSLGNQVVGPLLKSTRGQGVGEAEKVSYENSFTTRIFTDAACEFIAREKEGKPFYLHLAHNAVHMPTYVVEEGWARKVGARYVPWDREAKVWRFPYWEPNKETNKMFHIKWGHMGEVDRHGRRCYLSHLLALDHSVTRILDTLEKTGQRKNTLVVFLSDNGGTINTYSDNTPLSGFKYMFGEGGLRIPLLVSMPGTLPEGESNEALVSAMDVLPTAVELAGGEVPDNLDGKSLLPLLREGKTSQHEWLAWAKDRQRWVIRKGKWKLTNKAGWKHRDFTIDEEGFCHPAEEDYVYPDEPQLFDLENDPGETTNLIAKHPEVVAELRRLQASWAAEMADPISSKKRQQRPREKRK